MIPSVEALDVSPLARAFRALGDETRVRIVALLSHGELCGCHLEKALAIAQPTVSRSLGILRAAGIVEGRRAGSWIYYRLVAQDRPALQAALDGLIAAFGPQRVLQRDLARLKKACGPGMCG